MWGHSPSNLPLDKPSHVRVAGACRWRRAVPMMGGCAEGELVPLRLRTKNNLVTRENRYTLPPHRALLVDSAGIFPRNRIPLPRRGYSRLRDAACKASLPRRLFGGGHGALLPAALALVAPPSSSSSSTGRRDAVLYRRVLGRSLNSLASVGRQASTALMIASMRCDPSRSTCWNGSRSVLNRAVFMNSALNTEVGSLNRIEYLTPSSIQFYSNGSARTHYS